jgi:ArsR family transcriptional regulator
VTADGVILAADEELATLCKALGHPARVAILRHLLNADSCVFGSLAEVVPLAPSTVAQHLAQLKTAGLICQWDDGARSCYCADRTRVAALRQLLGGL